MDFLCMDTLWKDLHLSMLRILEGHDVAILEAATLAGFGSAADLGPSHVYRWLPVPLHMLCVNTDVKATVLFLQSTSCHIDAFSSVAQQVRLYGCMSWNMCICISSCHRFLWPWVHKSNPRDLCMAWRLPCLLIGEVQHDYYVKTLL